MKPFAFIAAMWCIVIDSPGVALVVLGLILLGCLMNKKLLDHAVVFFIAAAGFSLLSIAFSILAFAVPMLK